MTNFASMEEAVDFVHTNGQTATENDARSIMEYVNTLPCLEQLLFFKLANLAKHTPFVGKVLRVAGPQFKSTMEKLAKVIVTGDSMGTSHLDDEEKAIYALVKSA